MSAFPLARIAGLEIRIHVSWVLVMAAIAVAVSTRATVIVAESDQAVAWVVGAVVALGFLLSTVAHELAHAIAARRAGAPGGPVVVYFFGGAASPVLEVARPRDEVAAALAGPLTSIGIGLAAVASGAAILAIGIEPLGVVGDAVILVGVLDLVLGGANLLPAFPLDGGRVVRGLAWARTGDAARALRIAADVGRWLGIALAVAGAVVLLGAEASDGLMLALCGWLLISQGRAVERTATVDGLLEGMAVRDVMETDPLRVPVGVTLDTFADRLRGPGDAVPIALGSEVVGVLGARQVRGVPQRRWGATRAGDVMTTREVIPPIRPDVTVRAVLELFRRAEIDGVAVEEAQVITGIVTRRAVGEAIRERTRHGLVD